MSRAATVPKAALAFVAALLFAAAGAAAHHAGERFQVGEIVVSHAWTNETTATADTAAVYLTLENLGEAADRLVAAEASFAGPAVFQAQILGADGVLRTAEVPAVEIAAGQRLTFQPGGIHIVLPDISRQLRGGDHFHLTLTFAEAGKVEIDVAIEGDHEHDDDHDHHHDHDHGHGAAS